MIPTCGGSQLSLSTVLILSYHFYPSNEIGARRVTALARYLAERGVRVVVVSAFDDRPIPDGTEICTGIVAIPVRRPTRTLLNALVALKRRAPKAGAVTSGTPSSGANYAEPPTSAPAARFLSELRELYFRVLYVVDEYKRWSWAASKAAIAAGRQYGAQVVFASGPPHSALVSGARAAGRLRIPYVADLRDPWSDVVSAVYPQKRIEISVLRRLERWVMHRSTTITSTSATVAALLRDRYPWISNRIRVISNGYDGMLVPGLFSTSDRLSILFAGELYIGRDPFPFLTALEWLLARPEVDATRIEVTFMGRVTVYSGQSLPAWLVGKRCASVVRILPPQQPEAVAAAAGGATLLLNLAQQQPLSVPAKTFEQLASGREILLICEPGCETARLVAGIRGVNVVDPSNPDAMRETLLDLYQRHVMQGAARVPATADVIRFSRAHANAELHGVLASLVECPSPHRGV